MNELKIAAAYVRVSTDDQAEYSPDAQLVELKKYANTHGYIIPEEYIYIDQGISGKNTSKRESFNAMIGTAKSKPKPFDVILVWKFSRFARNREDSVVYKSMLRKQLGINVVSISEPVGEDKMSVIMEAMIEAMDEYYSINLAEEVRRGMSEKARRGELQATASFGYRVENNQLIPVEEEAVLLREIFARYLQGQGFFPIAKWLNSVGARTHRGGKFENRTVEYILRNPVYIGKLRWNPTGKTRRDYENENILEVQSTHAPLIDMETWDKVQTAIKIQKATTKRSAKPNWQKKDWLSGVVRCASCGGTLIFTKPHYFKCNNYAQGACATSQHVHRDLLHEAIRERLADESLSCFDIDFHVIHSKSTGADEISLLEKSLETVKRKKERLQQAFLAGTDTVEEYAAMKSALNTEEESVQSKLDNLKQISTPDDVLMKMRERIANCSAVLLSEASIEEKFSVLHEIVETCTFDKATSTLALEYRFVM